MLQGEFYLLSDALSLLFSVYEWNNKHRTVNYDSEATY